MFRKIVLIEIKAIISGCQCGTFTWASFRQTEDFATTSTAGRSERKLLASDYGVSFTRSQDTVKLYFVQNRTLKITQASTKHQPMKRFMQLLIRHASSTRRKYHGIGIAHVRSLRSSGRLTKLCQQSHAWQSIGFDPINLRHIAVQPKAYSPFAVNGLVERTLLINLSHIYCQWPIASASPIVRARSPSPIHDCPTIGMQNLP